MKPTFTNAETYLADHGIAPTLQRIAVIDDLYSHRTHATADEILERLCSRYPKFTQRTVYNALNLFVEKGLVSELNIDGVSARYDFDTRFHGHFRCTHCGRIFDFAMCRLAANSVPCGRVESAQYYAYGVCRTCSDNEMEQKNEH